MLKTLFNSRPEKLARALTEGDEERLLKLLGNQPADEWLQITTPEGQHLLELSIRAGQPRMLQLLLQRLPDTATLPAASCGTPLPLLALKQPGKRLALLSALLRAGADANLVHAGRPLLHHCQEHCAESELMLHLSRLLEHGADINQPDAEGTTLLLRLLPEGNLPLLQFLLQSGARCEPEWLESLPDPVLAAQLQRTLDDMRIRAMLQGG